MIKDISYSFVYFNKKITENIFILWTRSTMDSSTEKVNPLVIKSVSDLLARIKVGKVKGSLNVALSTLAVLEEIISQAENANPYELVTTLQAAGGMLRRSLPHQPTAANVARRVLRAVRLETRASADQSGEVASGDSLQKLVLARPARRGTLGSVGDLREPIRDHIAELRLELESTVTSIASQALEHIDADSVVMCSMDTPLIEQFLKKAAREHTFRLVLPEGPSIQQTHGLAARMSDAGIPVTVITNAAVFAVMSRITKVVLELSCAFSGGAVLAAPGAHNITSAAQFYNVPVLVLCPLYKLTPLHAADPQDVPLGNPQLLHNYADHACDSSRVYTPAQDFITPDQLTLFITNTGGSSPSYIYRTMSELYDPDEL